MLRLDNTFYCLPKTIDKKLSSILLYFEIDVSSVLTRVSEYNIMSTLCLHKYAGLDKKTQTNRNNATNSAACCTQKWLNDRIKPMLSYTT